MPVQLKWIAKKASWETMVSCKRLSVEWTTVREWKTYYMTTIVFSEGRIDSYYPEKILNLYYATIIIWDKLKFSCEIGHYGKSSTSIFQEIFISTDKIFISREGLCTKSIKFWDFPDIS